MYGTTSGWSAKLSGCRGLAPMYLQGAILGHWVGSDVSHDKNWNQRAYICRRQQHGFEIAEYSNGMYSVRPFMTQSSFGVLGKQIRFFICRDASFAQKICAECILKIPCPALIVSLL